MMHRSPSRLQRSIKGWYEPRMREVLEYVFKACFIRVEIKRGNRPSFIAQFSEHTNRDLLAEFKANFLDANDIPMHFSFVIEDHPHDPAGPNPGSARADVPPQP